MFFTSLHTVETHRCVCGTAPCALWRRERSRCALVGRGRARLYQGLLISLPWETVATFCTRSPWTVTSSLAFGLSTRDLFLGFGGMSSSVVGLGSMLGSALSTSMVVGCAHLQASVVAISPCRLAFSCNFSFQEKINPLKRLCEGFLIVAVRCWHRVGGQVWV